ncbi:MAG: OmpH family outer membrane protein [Phycisphaerales bacterium]|nr:OmpH family outer membrane protein [Phycisphaerales bacterium]
MVDSRRWNRNTISVAVMGLLVLWGLATPAMAQRGRPSEHPAGRQVRTVELPDLGQARPIVQTADLNAFVTGLGVDESMKVVVEMMLTSYQDSFREGSSAYREAVSKLTPDSDGVEDIEAQKKEAQATIRRLQQELQQARRNGGDDYQQKQQALRDAMVEIRQQINEFDRAKAAAMDWGGYFNEYLGLFETWVATRDQLAGDLQAEFVAFLEPEQAAYMEPVMIDIRLNREIQRGELNGEALDLDGYVRAQPFTDEEKAAAAPVIAAWKRAANDAIVARQVGFDDVIRGYIAGGSGRSAPTWMNAARHELALREAVRDVNLSYIQQIADVLSVESSRNFREVVLGKIYPSVFARSKILRAIEESLAARPPLEDGERAAVEELRIEAIDWMLDFAVRSSYEWQLQDTNRLLSTRRRVGESVIPAVDFEADQLAQPGTDGRTELQSWEAVMMERLQGIIGQSRYSKLSSVRSAPGRGGAEGRGGRGGAEGRGGRGGRGGGPGGRGGGPGGRGGRGR